MHSFRFGDHATFMQGYRMERAQSQDSHPDRHGQVDSDWFLHVESISKTRYVIRFANCLVVSSGVVCLMKVSSLTFYMKNQYSITLRSRTSENEKKKKKRSAQTNGRV